MSIYMQRNTVKFSESSVGAQHLLEKYSSKEGNHNNQKNMVHLSFLKTVRLEWREPLICPLSNIFCSICSRLGSQCHIDSHSILMHVKQNYARDNTKDDIHVLRIDLVLSFCLSQAFFYISKITINDWQTQQEHSLSPTFQNTVKLLSSPPVLQWCHNNSTREVIHDFVEEGV